MSEVIDITKERKQKVKQERDRKLDIEASYAAIETCLKIININDLKELRSLKSSMRLTLNELRKKFYER
jgi:hypothetical protein